MIKSDEPGRILVLKEKHATRFFDIATLDQLHAVALKILAERAKGQYAYIVDPGTFKEASPSTEEYNPTDEEIKALPEPLQAHATTKRAAYRRELRSYQREKEQFTTARKALKDKDGEAAWDILQDRDGYEYEGFRIEYLENTRTRRR